MYKVGGQHTNELQIVRATICEHKLYTSMVIFVNNSNFNCSYIYQMILLYILFPNVYKIMH